MIVYVGMIISILINLFLILEIMLINGNKKEWLINDICVNFVYLLCNRLSNYIEVVNIFFLKLLWCKWCYICILWIYFYFVSK